MIASARLLILILVFADLGYAGAQSWRNRTEVGAYGGIIQYDGEYGNQFFQTDPVQGAFALSVSHYLSDNFSLGLLYSFGKIDHRHEDRNLSGELNSMNLLVRYYFLSGCCIKPDATIAPFLMTGFGGSEWNLSRPGIYRLTDAFVPAGAGFRIRVTESLSFLLQMDVHFTMTDQYDRSALENGNDHFLFALAGLSYSFQSSRDSDGDGVTDRKDRCPDTPQGVQVDERGCPTDGDADGVPDYLDKCPDLPGASTASGCPDRDGDGIRDEEDRCPETAGLWYFSGCPDADGDSIPDAEDRCPEVKGIAAMQGCPDRDGDLVADDEDACPDEKGVPDLHGCPDQDGDGIADKDDRCPTVAGIPSNKGCPEIREEVRQVFGRALKGIRFETGSDRLKVSSYKVLDEIVLIMSDHPEYVLVISGHTDNTGKPEMNLELSRRRASASREYLISKGVEESRVTSEGFGDTRPVDDNATTKGRAANRRVEFKVVF